MNRCQCISIISIVVSIWIVLLFTPCTAGVSQYSCGALGTISSPEGGSARDDDRAYTGSSICKANAHHDDNFLIAHIGSSEWNKGFRPLPHEAAEDQPHVLTEKYQLTIDKAVFTCSEDHCDHYYRECGLAIDYTVSSEQIKSSISEAEISCQAAIIYHTKNGYQLNSNAGPELSLHTFRHHVSVSSHLSLTFYFSEYEQVIGAQLDNLECRVHQHDSMSGGVDQRISRK